MTKASSKAKSSLQVLKEARELIADEKRWCRGFLAIDASGRRVDSLSKKAAQWCALGALERATNKNSHMELGAFTSLMDCTLGLFGRSIVTVNNEYGHAAIMKAFDCAISKAESRS